MGLSLEGKQMQVVALKYSRCLGFISQVDGSMQSYHSPFHEVLVNLINYNVHPKNILHSHASQCSWVARAVTNWVSSWEGKP